MPDNSTASSSLLPDDGVEREDASVNPPGNPPGNPSETSFRFLPPPQTPAQHLLRAIVIGMGVLLILMFAAVVVGIVMKVRGHGEAPKPGVQSGAFKVPEGAQIEHMEVTGGRLILRLKTDKGEEVDIVDTKSGRLVRRIETPSSDRAPDVPQSGGP